MLLWLKAMVVSVREKAQMNASGTYPTEANASEPLMRCRKDQDDVKTGCESTSGTSSEATCLLSERHPAQRRRDQDTGFYMERENLSSGCKGRRSSGGPARARVPMPGTGTEQLVVVMKGL